MYNSLVLKWLKYMFHCIRINFFILHLHWHFKRAKLFLNKQNYFQATVCYVFLFFENLIIDVSRTSCMHKLHSVHVWWALVTTRYNMSYLNGGGTKTFGVTFWLPTKHGIVTFWHHRPLHNTDGYSPNSQHTCKIITEYNML